MKVKLLPKIGGRPVVMDVSQFIVCQDNGTPIMVGAEYGTDNSQAVSMVGQPDFQRMLQLLGVHTTVVVDTLQMPAPQPGARLIADPNNPREDR